MAKLDLHPWWAGEFAPIGVGYGFDTNWCESALIKRALVYGQTVYSSGVNGEITVEFSELLKHIEAAHAMLKLCDEPAWRTSEAAVYYTWKDGLMRISHNSEGVSAYLTTTDKDVFDAIKAVLDEHLKPRVSAGKVFAMISTEEGIKLTSMGVAAAPLEESNYMPHVIEAYQHVVADFSAAEPCGRLVILDGQPGTGKTYLVRALLKDVPNALFVMIPSGMVSSLTDPGFLPAVLNMKGNSAPVHSPDDYHSNVSSDRPVVFVIEDADACLVERAADNMRSVSSLLNFGDGIMGSLINLRIICTTNAGDDDLDPAIMRPGRLCKRIQIQELMPEQVAKVYERLTGKSVPQNMYYKSMTLAEVYRYARDDGWQPEEVKRKVGFAPESKR